MQRPGRWVFFLLLSVTSAAAGEGPPPWYQPSPGRTALACWQNGALILAETDLEILAAPAAGLQARRADGLTLALLPLTPAAGTVCLQAERPPQPEIPR